VWLGDGADARKLAEAASRLGGAIDFLFLDGTPKETLAYLDAAAPHLAPGALVVADNAGVFAEGGMRPYLERVRGGGEWSSARVAAALEWRPDVPDALEVSVYRGAPGEAEALAEAAAAAGAAARGAAAAAAAAGAPGGASR
jgi:predicted O-methyltransferase YrrM